MNEPRVPPVSQTKPPRNDSSEIISHATPEIYLNSDPLMARYSFDGILPDAIYERLVKDFDSLFNT